VLTLNSRNVALSGLPADKRSMVLRLRRGGVQPVTLGDNEALLADGGTAIVPGQMVVVLKRDAAAAAGVASRIIVPNELDYLADGDVLAVELQRPAVRVIYRRNSQHNSFLLTERCNHYCLMCSQPPKDINDDWIVNELFQTIPLISPETKSLGFTEGEPTLLGERFLRLVSAVKEQLPATALHILSNGRRFVDPSFAHAYAAIGHPDAMLGIPIYSASSQTHDYIVQADGAFDETIRGILNLKTYGQQVEIRVVIHRQNYAHLPRLAEFIARNLTFVDHVALMGLEMTGFAKANIDTLWIDPVDYRQELYEAVALLEDFGYQRRSSIISSARSTIGAGRSR
jgi:His-Xaa-Ser system radical SAM maturase HxsC